MADTFTLPEPLWQAALANLKTRVTDQTFNAWFYPIQPLLLADDTLTLGVPNIFFREWLEERYYGLINSVVAEVTQKKIKILFTVSQKKIAAEPVTGDGLSLKKKKTLFSSLFPKHHAAAPAARKALDPKHTFERFVVGSGNRFSYAAFSAVSESPAKTYNPLFVYGGVGLGKTHLMHALGNQTYQKFPQLKILYISSEEFTNQLIMAIQTRTMPKFRQRYRNVDVLLIDDIHFIAGKESTQEEFFHTFNALFDAHKQIVLSSDRSPKEISKLEERLVSRFEWGLVTDIQPPDFETRVAILRKKCEFETVRVPDDVLTFLGENITSNIRELEGGLIRVVAYSKLFSQPVTAALAREVLKGMIKEAAQKVNVDLIQKRVADYFSIGLSDMKAKKRTQAVVYPRQIAMFLSRDMTRLSLPEIGAYFGGRDHTTVIHACNKIEKDIKSKEDTRKTIKELVYKIKS